MSAPAVLYDLPGPQARRRHRIGTIAGAVFIALLLGYVGWQLLIKGQFAADMWEPFTRANVQRALWIGYRATLLPAAMAIALALVLGMVLAAGRLSRRRWISAPVGAIVEFFRAIPLLLLIFFFFLGYSAQLGLLGSLVVALAIYNGCVLSEVFRAGINAIPRGQSEAAYALGLRKTQAMRLILLPQSVKIMLPAIVSQCVVTLKDTALGFIIGYSELLGQGRSIFIFYDNHLPTLAVVAAIYIVTCYALSKLAEWLERRQHRVMPVRPLEGGEVTRTAK